MTGFWPAMLLPAKQRSKTFYIGREFDPVKVGLDTTGASGKFLENTAQRGNSNAGHSFEDGPRGNGIVGPLLTDAQRWALVEYLKSIPSEAGRVTPFGGPPNARAGKQPWGEYTSLARGLAINRPTVCDFEQMKALTLAAGISESNRIVPCSVC